MPRIRYLSVRFTNRLRSMELPYFRSAIIEATERQSSLFHNHQSDASVIYRYPLIQYKLLGGQASILCLEQGTDDIHFLFQQRSLQLRIGQKTEDFSIEDIRLEHFTMDLLPQSTAYHIRDWQALNQENYKRYLALESEIQRLEMLERLLKGHLLSLAEGVGWKVEAPIELTITQRIDERWLSYKKQKALCFSLEFNTNLSIPPYIGLGKGVSVGFGVVTAK